MFNTVSIIGLGYIGLPTAAMLASRKIKVIGVDISQHVVDTINKGQIHIIEPELDALVSAAVRQGYLRATTKPEPADAFLIAVPTPFMGEHKPDLRFVKTAAKSVAQVLKKGDLVILESTSPVGTTEQMAEWLSEERPDLSFPQKNDDVADINLAYCPERVLPGKVVHELVNNDRVIGGITERCSLRAIELYKTFIDAECLKTDARTAEMCKLTENSFRDVNIAFANELSIICERIDINVWDLIKLANRHPRVNILQPGPGVGGHCIAVDPWLIVAKTPNEAKLIRTAREVNDQKPHWIIDKVKAAVAWHLQENPGKSLSEVSIACYGLAFKADIDDLRESPAIEIVRNLLKSHSGPILLVEPHISELPVDLSEAQLVCENEARGDINLMLVGHQQFINKLPPNGILIDACGAWSKK